jgi:hypothetical protein
MEKRNENVRKLLHMVRHATEGKDCLYLYPDSAHTSQDVRLMAATLIKAGIDCEWNNSSRCIDFKSGGRITFRSDAEIGKLRGCRFTSVFIDEFCPEDPELVNEIANLKS